MNSQMLSVIKADIAEIAQNDLPWELFSGRTVAVTGASGFLATYLVRFLLALNDLKKVSKPVTVVGLVRNLERAKINYSDLLEDSNNHLQILEWDLGRFEIPPLKNCNYILHVASQASPRYYSSDPVGTLLPNTVGTAALLEALRQSDDPQGYLFVSSAEIYGNATGVLDEKAYGLLDPTAVRSCYGESKRMGETMCVSWQHQYGIKTVIVRPFHTYGPGLVPEDGRVFSDFVFNVVRGENIVMKSDGSAKRAFCYVSDAIAGFLAVLLKGQSGEAYNVAHPDGELSVSALADLVVGLRPAKKLSVERQLQPQASGYQPNQIARAIPDVEKLKGLAWTPKISPEVGFERMIKAYE